MLLEKVCEVIARICVFVLAVLTVSASTIVWNWTIELDLIFKRTNDEIAAPDYYSIGGHYYWCRLLCDNCGREWVLCRKRTCDCVYTDPASSANSNVRGGRLKRVKVDVYVLDGCMLP